MPTELEAVVGYQSVQDLMANDELSGQDEFIMPARRGGHPITISLKEVEQLAALGLGLNVICDYYGISSGQLYQMRKKFDALDAAVCRGQAMGQVMVAKKVVEHIRAGDKILPMFYLKAKGGWSENAPRDEAVGSQTHVQLYLPDNQRDKKDRDE